jgi:hypothetical protein
MRRTLLVLVVTAIATSVAFAGGTAERSGRTDPLCGTWYGGSSNPDHAGYKYQYTFIPTGRDRWYVMAQGLYTAATFGGAILTNWTGEVLRSGDTYELRLIGMTTNDPVDPPDELPTVIGGRAWVTLQSEHEAKIEYDMGGVYSWGKRPFIDDPDMRNITPDAKVTEIIHRMRTDVTINQ